MASVDLTVRGGGITGLAIAWEAARRGAKVRLVEAQALGAGASSGLVGALAPHAPEGWTPVKAFQLDSLLAAEAFFAGVEAASGLPTHYARLGRLQPIPDAAALAKAQARAEAAATLWQGRALWQIRPAADFPHAPAAPLGLVVHDTLSARLHPRRTLAALARAIMAKGGQIVLGEAEEDSAPVVWATGAPGLADLSAQMGRAMGSGVKGQAASLVLDLGHAPQLYVDGLHIVPHGDGTVAIGSTSETTWADPAATDDQLEALIARARAVLPALAQAPILHRWAGIRPRARSRGPLLGPWPGRPGHYLANGGFKIGFGLAPGVARLMVDLVLEGRDALPAAFRPD
jgi:glycine oxidase